MVTKQFPNWIEFNFFSWIIFINFFNLGNCILLLQPTLWSFILDMTWLLHIGLRAGSNRFSCLISVVKRTPK